MSEFPGNFRNFVPRAGGAVAKPGVFASVRLFLCAVGFAFLTMPTFSFADSRTGSAGAQASIDFCIIIPAIIRITTVTQPERLVIEDRHISQGFIDLDAATAVKITINHRDGYLLSARYDAQLLSAIEVRVSSHNLATSAGAGSMRVASGLATDKLLPISYRLYLAPGARAGDYRWPVTLAFSLAFT
jgi:hypothetical protein